MFEKEAEKYAENNAYKYASDYITCQEAYKDGAEFGYNKALERNCSSKGDKRKMTKEELEREYYGRRPTEPYSEDDSPNDWANIVQYAEENLDKAFKAIAELEKENAELTKSKEIIKDYMIIAKGAHITVCGVPEENRTIYVLKLNKEAEQFIKDNGF